MWSSRRPPLAEQPVHPFRLRDRPHHPVEEHAPGGLGLVQLLADDAEDQVVPHEVPRLHHGPGLEAEGRAALDGVPEEVARGELGQPEPLGEQGALRSLPRARGPHQQDVHVRILSPTRNED